MLKLKEFIQNNTNWEEILSNFPYNLIIKRDFPYIMFKYNQLSSDFTIDLVREARGVIFREDTWKCVCHSFDKFGNYGESYCPEIDWSTASVQEKVDGSLIKFWYDDLSWHISTNGTIDAYKATIGDSYDVGDNSYGKLVLTAIVNAGLTVNTLFENLNKDNTYMFELVSPQTRVVVPYTNTELYFLGYRSKANDREYSPHEENCDEVVEFIKKYFKVPKIYSLYTLEQVEAAAKILTWNEEGYVICDTDFNRVKIKSPEYVKVHHLATLKGLITTERLIDLVIKNEQDEFLAYFPEYKVRVMHIYYIRLCVYGNCIADLRDIENNYHPKTRKEFAEIVNTRYPTYERPYLFAGSANLAKKLFKEMTVPKYSKLIKDYLNDERWGVREWEV